MLKTAAQTVLGVLAALLLLSVGTFLLSKLPLFPSHLGWLDTFFLVYFSVWWPMVTWYNMSERYWKSRRLGIPPCTAFRVAFCTGVVFHLTGLVILSLSNRHHLEPWASPLLAGSMILLLLANAAYVYAVERLAWSLPQDPWLRFGRR
jgi:hypothetical protein